jgi:peptidoglycan/xylan/chitin deacetylase (PgdA/CDA1 family)
MRSANEGPFLLSDDGKRYQGIKNPDGSEFFLNSGNEFAIEYPVSFGMVFNDHNSDASGYRFLDAANWQPSQNGSNIPIFESSTAFTKYGDVALKQGNIAGASTVHGKYKDLALTHDLTNVDGFTFWVYCDGPLGNSGGSVGSQVMFAVGDAAMANSSWCNILGVAGGSWRRGWNNVRITKSDLSNVLTGTGVNWASVKRIQIRFTPNATYTGNSLYITDLFVGGFANNKKAPVVLTFDDSHEESVALINIANSFGIPCTNFVMPDYVDDHATRTTYQTIAQIRQLYAQGNAICGHHQAVNAFVDTPSLMGSVSAWLRGNGFTRDDMHLYLSYPNGAFNQSVIDIAKSIGIKGARSIIGINRNDATGLEESVSSIGIEPVANGGIADPYKINSPTYTNASTALAYVDRAIAAQAGVVFYGHTFADGITQAEMYTLCVGLKTRMAAGTIECMTFPQFCQAYS